jgi:hypothetical protein
MVADEERDVKRSRREQCLAWIDSHPRVGWYWTVLLILNTILNFLDLFHG